MANKIKFEDSFAFKHPHLADEWHSTKNEVLKASDVKSKSKKKVWWRCKKGHEWEAAVQKRSVGTGCPYCSGKRVIKGETDLATLYPKLAKEWHPTKNGDLKASDVKSKSKKEVWWRCEKGHEWVTAVQHRSLGTGCPYCSGKRVIKGETDLATLYPKLAKEWHPTKNGDLKSSDVKCKSNKEVWWRCEKGHEWEAIVADRTEKGRGCPYCSGKRAVKGETDLATVNPILAKQWNFTKNGNLKPEDVMPQSHKRVWWQCEKGHEWYAAIYSRNEKGCPYCSGQRVIKGGTDLATVNPILAKEWHPTKNGKLKPQDVTSQSHKIVWWKCEKGHEWERSIHGRANNNGCPYCSGRFAVKGETDLATVNPIITKEWHPTKNVNLKPEEVTAKSHKKVWWQCEKGHEWRAMIASRASGNGCPECRKYNRDYHNRC